MRCRGCGKVILSFERMRDWDELLYWGGSAIGIGVLAIVSWGQSSTLIAMLLGSAVALIYIIAFFPKAKDPTLCGRCNQRQSK